MVTSIGQLTAYQAFMKNFAIAQNNMKSMSDENQGAFAIMSDQEFIRKKRIQDSQSGNGSNIIENVIGKIENTGKMYEQTAKMAIEQKASHIEILAAMKQMTTTMETAVAIRNEVIKAYQQIERMQV